MVEFTIDGRLHGLNEYVEACRRNRYAGNNMKKQDQTIAASAIRLQLKDVHFDEPVQLSYVFYEKNKRRDHDNVSSFAHKVIQDALVQCNIINDDGWEEITGYTDDFQIDKENPRIVVRIIPAFL